MTHDDERLIRWKVINMRGNIPHWYVQGAVDLAESEFVRLSHVEKDVLDPCISQTGKVLRRNRA